MRKKEGRGGKGEGRKRSRMIARGRKRERGQGCEEKRLNAECCTVRRGGQKGGGKGCTMGE